MPEINLVDQTLKNYHNQTEISIQVCLNGFSYLISTRGDKTIRAIRHYNFKDIILQEDLLNQTDEILYKDELLRLPHQKVKIIFTSRKSTLVPNDFFNKETLKRYLEFNQPLDELDEIHYNEVEKCSSKLVFALPTYFAAMILDKFKNVSFFNQATPFLNLIYEVGNNKEGYTVVINLNKDFFDIAVVQKNQLKFYNNFLYINSTDLLYFILYVFRQLKIDEGNSKTYIVGGQIVNEQLISELSVYLKNIMHLEAISDIHLAPVLHKINTDRFAPLIKLMFCE